MIISYNHMNTTEYSTDRILGRAADSVSMCSGESWESFFVVSAAAELTELTPKKNGQTKKVENAKIRKSLGL